MIPLFVECRENGWSSSEEERWPHGRPGISHGRLTSLWSAGHSLRRAVRCRSISRRSIPGPRGRGARAAHRTRVPRDRCAFRAVREQPDRCALPGSRCALQQRGRDSRRRGYPCHFDRGVYTVAVSTGSRSPAVSRFIREEIEKNYPALDAMIALQHRLRETLKERMTTPEERRRILWAVLRDKAIWTLLSDSPEPGVERVSGRYLHE